MYQKALGCCATRYMPCHTGVIPDDCPILRSRPRLTLTFRSDNIDEVCSKPCVLPCLRRNVVGLAKRTSGDDLPHRYTLHEVHIGCVSISWEHHVPLAFAEPATRCAAWTAWCSSNMGLSRLEHRTNMLYTLPCHCRGGTCRWRQGCSRWSHPNLC